MNVYPIPDELAGAYKGAGYALAAISGGALVDLLYLHDLLPDFDPDNPQAFLSDHRLSASIAHLSRLGDVSIGMCSAWEFCEL